MLVTKHKLEMTESALRAEIVRLKGKLEQLGMDYRRNMSAYAKQLHQLEESNKLLLDYLNLREEKLSAKTVLRPKDSTEAGPYPAKHNPVVSRVLE